MTEKKTKTVVKKTSETTKTGSPFNTLNPAAMIDHRKATMIWLAQSGRFENNIASILKHIKTRLAKQKKNNHLKISLSGKNISPIVGKTASNGAKKEKAEA